MTVWWRLWDAATSRGGWEPPLGNYRGSEELIPEVELRECAKRRLGGSVLFSSNGAPGKDVSELAGSRAAGGRARNRQGQERHHRRIGLRLRRFRDSLSANETIRADDSALVREGVLGAVPKSTAPQGSAQPAVYTEWSHGDSVAGAHYRSIILAESTLGCMPLLRCLASGGTQGQIHRTMCLRSATAASTSAPSSPAVPDDVS